MVLIRILQLISDYGEFSRLEACIAGLEVLDIL